MLAERSVVDLLEGIEVGLDELVQQVVARIALFGRTYVERSVAEDPLKELVFGAVVGSQRFVEWARGLLKEKGEDPEISQLDKARLRPGAEEVCEVVADAYGIALSVLTRKGLKRNESRNTAAYLARVHTGRKLAEVGEHFGGPSSAAVSRACRRVETKLRGSRVFRKKIADLAIRVEQERSRKI